MYVCVADTADLSLAKQNGKKVQYLIFFIVFFYFFCCPAIYRLTDFLCFVIMYLCSD